MTGNRSFYLHVVAFTVGALGAHFLPFLIPAWVAAVAGAAMVPLLAVAWLRPAAWLLLGALWALLRADLVLGASWPTDLEGRDVELVGVVASLPQAGERYLKFDLDVEQVRFEARPVDFRARARIRWYDIPAGARQALKAGSRWRLRARLKQPHGYYNPGGFDYEAYLYRERIRATGYVRDAAINKRLQKRAGAPLQAYRQRLRDRLDAATQQAAHQGLLRALALGDRSAISDQQWATLRNTGTSHLIAISGLHVGFAAVLGAWLGGGLGRLAGVVAGAVVAPRAGALTGAAVALGYALLSGFDVPAQRAFVMAAVFLLALYCRRHAWTPRNLCAALAFVIVINPASVQDPGFWLSFAAVALIIAWVTGRDAAPGRAGRVLAAVRLQVLLSLALLPLVAAFFDTAPLVGAPANLVAVPAVMFTIVPLCLAGVVALAAGWPGAAGALLGVADGLLEWLWGFLSWAGGLDYAAAVVRLDIWRAAALMAGVFWWLLARPGRRWWGGAFAAALLVPASAAPAPGAFRLTVLDVGQGLAAVIHTRHHTLVYDTGPRYPGGFSLARAVVIPYLRWHGVDRVDKLIISHGDNDHRGGYEDLLAALPVDTVASSIAHKLAGAVPCRRGQSWQWDGVTFEILHPRGGRPPEHNNASCVLRVAGPFGSVLLTGDIEARAELALLGRDRQALRSDVLLVPHQGSATSSSASFIDAVQPSRAIVAAGYRNRYGHPHAEVMARYRRRGIATWNTAGSGAVMVRVIPAGIEVRGWRQSKPRFWLDPSAPAQDGEAI